MRRFPPIFLAVLLTTLAVACGSGASAKDGPVSLNPTVTANEPSPTIEPPTSTPPPAANQPKTTAAAPVATSKPSAAVSSAPPVILTPFIGAAPPPNTVPTIGDSPSSDINPGGPMLPCCKPLVTPGTSVQASGSVNQATIASPPAGIGTTSAPAPIESVTVQPQSGGYAVVVRAGLPNGCAKPGGQNVNRDGTTFVVNALNTTAAGNVACTQIYGTYNFTQPLPGPFASGQTYTVRVNDKSATFTAQ